MYPIVIPDKFRLDMISDRKKELENNITHYRRVLAELKKIRSACHTICIRDLKQTTTATARRTWKNKRSNCMNNSAARAL